MDINNIKDQYTCFICQNIYKNPIKLSKCGHNMCNDCIINYSSSQSQLNCPLCRVPYEKSDIILDQNLNMEMFNKSVKCDCGQVMPLNQYYSHYDNCAVVIKFVKFSGITQFLADNFFNELVLKNIELILPIFVILLKSQLSKFKFSSL